MGGIGTVAEAVVASLASRLPKQNKKQQEGLALLVATALQVRGVNLWDWDCPGLVDTENAFA